LNPPLILGQCRTSQSIQSPKLRYFFTTVEQLLADFERDVNEWS